MNAPTKGEKRAPAPKKFDPDEFERVKRELAQAVRVREWGAGKDLAQMLGSLDDFDGEIVAFKTDVPLGDNFVRALRRRPAAMRKAYKSACYELDPDRLVGEREEVQALAKALLQTLAVGLQEFEEEQQVAPDAENGEDHLEDSQCTVS